MWWNYLYWLFYPIKTSKQTTILHKSLYFGKYSKRSFPNNLSQLNEGKYKAKKGFGSRVTPARQFSEHMNHLWFHVKTYIRERLQEAQSCTWICSVGPVQDHTDPIRTQGDIKPTSSAQVYLQGSEPETVNTWILLNGSLIFNSFCGNTMNDTTISFTAHRS